ncbi:unnamed protein product [Mytilus coruscus]|uniref:GIY-YIG domain-containing protein n=1 Tax=Mytilus coruscus TaxID=42192 RepID=A0A6J8A5Y0_MYTCO|nr:unnamed protein product [Mytilus coruscus]
MDENSCNLSKISLKSIIKPNYGKIGSKPCEENCYLCKHMVRTETVKSHANNYQIKIRDDISCTTNNVVYRIECRICQLQYVGQTGNTLKERFRGHFQDINTGNKYKPVSIHFTSPRHNRHHVTITSIIKTATDVNIRLRTEEACINKLSTAEPWGTETKDTEMAKTKTTPRKKNNVTTNGINCTKCNEKLANIVTLKRHNYMYHEDTVKIFTCYLCDANFTRKYNIKKHIRTPKEIAFQIEKWVPPFEARKWDLTKKPTFRVIPGQPTVTYPEKQTTRTNILEHDLYLSDSNSTVNSQNQQLIGINIKLTFMDI